MNDDRSQTALSRRRLLGALTAAGGAWLLGGFGSPARAVADFDDDRFCDSDRAIARAIRAEFLHGWNGYKRFAWGHDEVKPVSGTFSEFFVPGHPLGLSIIEALDTLYVMELDTELRRSVDWIEDHLDFDIDGNIQVFEAIIRLVGGLLAGYLATRNRVLLDKCRDLADRLLPAFTQSPTGMPYRFVNLRTGAVSGPENNLAEIGTNILEFGLLSELTRDPRYFDASKRAYRAVVDRRSSLDLLGTFIHIETGDWLLPLDVAPNPPVDSFYEYLWGGWAMFRDRETRDWYRLLTRAIVERMSERVNGLLWFRPVDFQTGAPFPLALQSELAAFYAGLLAKGEQVALGEDYQRSWTAVARRFPILPEFIDYSTLAPLDPGNALRPEYVNSSFDLFMKTGKRSHKATALQYFDAMKAHHRTANGYTTITDVTTTPMTLGDLTPGYWFAENPKYLYLMFADSPRFDRRHHYLSTEGKILRGLRRRRDHHSESEP
jgi:hypothetical protein